MRNTGTTSLTSLKYSQEPTQEPVSSLSVSEGQEPKDRLGDAGLSGGVYVRRNQFKDTSHPPVRGDAGAPLRYILDAN